MKKLSMSSTVCWFLLLAVAVVPIAACSGDEGSAEDEGGDAGAQQSDSGDGQSGSDALSFPASDPAAEGAFKVGVMETSIDDHLSVDGESRPLRVVIWYPTESEEEPDAGLKGVVDAPVAEGGPFPLVAFSHGLGGYASQSTFQVAYLASHGFVVASPDHPNSTLQDCGLTFCLDTPENLTISYANRPAEIRAVVDLVLGESQREGAPLEGAVDSTKLGVMGHSYGGGTTVRLLAEEDNRFLAGIPLAPGILEADDVPKITSPVMFMLAEKDSLIAFPGASDAYRTLPESTERFLLIFPNADHFAYNDICVSGCGGEGQLDHALGHQLINTYGTAFMQVYVAGQTEFESYLEPADDIAGGEGRLIQGSLP
jgi:predicted dienelactone hydrolase